MPQLPLWLGGGRVIGVTGLGWALSLAATVPLAGWLVQSWGWSSPFLLVVALTAASAAAVWLAVPREAARTPAPPSGLRRSARQEPSSQRDELDPGRPRPLRRGRAARPLQGSCCSWSMR